MPILVIGAFSEVEVYHLRTIKVIVTDLEICMKFALKKFCKINFVYERAMAHSL